MQASLAPTPRQTGLLVAEAQALAREGLVGLLAGWPHGPVRAAASLDAAVSCLEQDRFCILLLDAVLAAPGLNAPGLNSPGLHTPGLDAIRPLRGRFPGLRIVVMAPQESRGAVLQALAAGAHGFVAKTAGFAELARAIETVDGGGVHLPPTMAEPSPPPASAPLPTSPLTCRQQDVLRLLAEGRSTKDIARSLDLAVSTIKVHLAAVYRTFGARNRVEALCRAGVLPSPAAFT